MVGCFGGGCGTHFFWNGGVAKGADIWYSTTSLRGCISHLFKNRNVIVVQMLSVLFVIFVYLCDVKNVFVLIAEYPKSFVYGRYS